MALRNHTVYIGGFFDLVAGQHCPGIASYHTNNQTWNCLVNEVEFFAILSMHYHEYSDTLIVGTITGMVVDGVFCGGVCLFRQNQWSSLGAFNDSVNSISSNPNSESLFFCGNFGRVEDVEANKIVEWNGTNFLPFIDGLRVNCKVVAWNTRQDTIYVGGDFQNGTIIIANIDKFNRSVIEFPNSNYTGQLKNIIPLHINSFLISTSIRILR